MFVEVWETETKPKEILGVIQTEQKSLEKDEYYIHYIKCKVNVFDYDETHTLDCEIEFSQHLEKHGKILHASQMYDVRQRRIAFVFDTQPHVIYVFYFWPTGFAYFGEKEYYGDAANQVTGVAIERGKLFVVLEYGKRVDVFALEDIYNPTERSPQAEPRLSINSRVMAFYNVKYFAPVGIKVSRYHPEFIFIKTKTGVMAVSVNDEYIP